MNDDNWYKETMGFKSILLAIALLVIGNITAFSQEEKEYSASRLRSDFKKFEKFLAAHPDPFTHISEESFRAKLDEVERSLDHPHTTLEFYKKLASLVALISDGHSAVYFPGSWWIRKLKANGCFPYEVYLTNDDELYVIKSYDNGSIQSGARIMAINGISVDSFIKAVEPFLSYEMIRFRNTIIDSDFNRFLYLAFGEQRANEITYFTADTLKTLVRNMPFKSWVKFQKEDRDADEKRAAMGRPYSYKKLEEGIGLIHVHSFAVGDVKAYELFLNKTFKQIRKDSIHSLIIDIRGNFGGWPGAASKLFHYISNTYFKTMAQSSMKVSYPLRELFGSFDPRMREFSKHMHHHRHFMDLEAIMNNTINTYVHEESLFNERPRNETYEFKGDCYLLTNRDSYSAASSFAATFQCYQMGTIIGEETGGTRIFRAAAIGELLPHSGIIIRMSTTKNYCTCYDQEFQGVLPNIAYSPSILELVSEQDIQLMYARRIIHKVQQAKQN